MGVSGAASGGVRRGIGRRAGPLPGALVPLAALLSLYIALPFAALLVSLLHRPGAPAIPLAWPLLISLLTAACATGAIALTGIPLGYLLARRHGLPSRILGVLLQLPLAVPPLVGGLLLLLVFGPYAPLGRVLPLSDTIGGIIAAQAFVAAPFLIVAARSAFVAVDPDIDGVAATLGLRPAAAFWRAVLPAAWPGVRAGLGLAFVRAFGEFGATLVLAYHPYGLPVATWVSFASTGLRGALPAAGLGTAAAAVVLTAVEVLGQRRPGAPATGGEAQTREPVPAPGAGLAAWRGARSRDPAEGGRLELEIEALRGSIGAFELILDGRPRGARLAILGPSGAGKSLALRLVAGLAPANGGRLACQGEVWLAGGRHVPAFRRHVGYVPQQGGLFPHLTAMAHLGFGLGHLPPAERAAPVAYWLRQLGLEDLARRRPHELSGGQRQRVALGRALAFGPRLLLLDEPFSALDAPVRRELQQALLLATGLPWVLVTHDPAEAARLSDEIWVLIGGRVVQRGAPAELRRQPSSPAVAAAIGLVNVFSAGRGPLPDPPGLSRAGAWCVAPEAVRLLAPDAVAPPGVATVRARVLQAAPTTGGYELTVLPQGAVLPLVVAAGPRPEVPAQPGAACLVGYDPADAHTWARR